MKIYNPAVLFVALFNLMFVGYWFAKGSFIGVAVSILVGLSASIALVVSERKHNDH